jgi:hypothetical protein
MNAGAPTNPAQDAEAAAVYAQVLPWQTAKTLIIFA